MSSKAVASVYVPASVLDAACTKYLAWRKTWIKACREEAISDLLSQPQGFWDKLLRRPRMTWEEAMQKLMDMNVGFFSKWNMIGQDGKFRPDSGK